MKPPELKIGGKIYKAQRPKTKLWREISRYRKVYGDEKAYQDNPDADEEAFDALLEIVVQLLPDGITKEDVEESTYLADYVNFAVMGMAWVDFIIIGKGQELPAKNG